MQRSTHQTKQSWHGFGSYPAMVTAGVMLYNIYRFVGFHIAIFPEPNNVD